MCILCLVLTSSSNLAIPTEISPLPATTAMTPPTSLATFGSRAARFAIDKELHDLWGKKLGQPLHKLFGLNPNNLPLTSFTIAIDELEVMAEQAKAAEYPILKIKLGSDQL